MEFKTGHGPECSSMFSNEVSFSDCGLCLFSNSSSQFSVEFMTDYLDNNHRMLLSLLLLPHSNVPCFNFVFAI